MGRGWQRLERHLETQRTREHARGRWCAAVGQALTPACHCPRAFPAPIPVHRWAVQRLAGRSRKTAGHLFREKPFANRRYHTALPAAKHLREGPRTVFSTNGQRQLYTHRGKKRTLVPALTPYTGIISRWVTDLEGELVPRKRRPGRSGTSKKGRQRRSGPAAELHRSLEAKKALAGAQSEPKVSRAHGQ